MKLSRSNRINKFSKEQLEIFVKQSLSLAEVLRKCGCTTRGTNYTILKNLLTKYNIDYSNIYHCVFRLKIKNLYINRYQIEDILSNKQPYTNNSVLKRRLIKLNLLENKCYKCGLGELWNNKKIILQLDHINGVKKDNSLNNLRILCANCHSQTKTFAGRNSPLENRILSYENFSINDLHKLLWEMPIKYIVKNFNIANTTIRKLIKENNLTQPPRGYWSHHNYDI